MTRAGIMQALVELGPRPPWWRPLKRRRWRRILHALNELYMQPYTDLILSHYTPEYFERQSRPINFANITKAPKEPPS